MSIGRQPVWEIISQEINLLLNHDETRWNVEKKILMLFLQGITKEEKEAIQRLKKGDILWKYNSEVKE